MDVAHLGVGFRVRREEVSVLVVEVDCDGVADPKKKRSILGPGIIRVVCADPCAALT